MIRPTALVLPLLAALPVQAESNLASQVPGVQILRFGQLTAAPAPGQDRESCAHLLVDPPATQAGRFVAGLGWGVTAEAAFGPYTAVSFVSGYAAATSGTCELRDGNVGLFRGDRLEAMVYASDEPAVLIGRISPFGTAGLRIFSGDVVPQPVADLRLLVPDGVIVTQPALSEPVCNATAEVPYVYGLPIDMARRLLAEAGWQPAPAAEPETFGMAPVLAAAGLTEVQGCAGTGFGFCSFAYAGPVGRLEVTTAGEPAEDGTLPAVVGYSADCGPIGGQPPAATP